MTTTRDVLALQLNAPAHEPTSAPDLEGLYRSVLQQLTANVESLVAHAFAAHAARSNLPLPASVKAALMPDPASDLRLVEGAGSTGNPGLDFLNEQLQRGAASIGSPSAVPTPPWLHPFTLPENVRFTRTPDPVLRWERAAPTAEELAVAAREAARLAAEQTARIAEDERERARTEASQSALPVWRRPFTLPPNVRYTRTPDPKLRRSEPAPDDAAPGEGGASSSNPELETSIHAFTVTQTVTTIGSVTLTTNEGGVAMQTPVENATALIEQVAEPTPNETIQGPDFLTLSASIRQRASSDTGLPSWFTVYRAEPELRAPAIEPADPVTDAEPATAPADTAPDAQAETMPALAHHMVDHADCEGSGVFDRSAFLPEMEDAPVLDTTPAVLAEAAVETVSAAALPAAADAIEERGSASTPQERRAFGSHGIAAFEAAVHFDGDPDSYDYPSIDLLAPPQKQDGLVVTREGLEQNARLLEGVLEDFGVRGEIIAVRPGPVVTLYEFEPAPGVKSSRVMNLADDIARSMSAISARVAVVQGRNVIGIELPNERRETVFLRELIGSDEFDGSNHKLAIALGKTIGGESVIVDLARMPHLLVAGTTGSGKSVAINTMILSLLYRLRPEECRLIMVDPKMLELSIYDGIPHLLTPVVTDSKKAVIALKWAVREMEDRYKKMAKVGVRNIDGFNARVTEAKLKGEVITRTVQQGFDRETGEPMFVTEEMDLATLPYIVIIVDEMADLMMVAGKEIEGAIQRLAQMARAAGIHLIMATQRPSVDVITGTIKANFPTRISFQVTSKIDSRTILGEQGAEQLLGQGDMLHMVGGGRISRVHGPFVSDGEVEKVVWHLKAQGHPEYLDVVTADEDVALGEEDDAPESAVFDRGSFGDESADLYDQAVKIVLRDKKCSTSYIQRRLQVGYNKAASIVERMEKEGLVGPANGTGKREILNFSRDHSRVIFMPGAED